MGGTPTPINQACLTETFSGTLSHLHRYQAHIHAAWIYMQANTHTQINSRITSKMKYVGTDTSDTTR